MRVAVMDLYSASWTAGGTYSRMLMRSLANAAPAGDCEICAVTGDDSSLPAGVRSVRDLPSRGSGWDALSRNLRAGAASGASRLLRDYHAPPPPWWTAVRRGIDVVLPVVGPPRFACGVPLVGWIPDLGHVRLPQFFSAAESAGRDAVYRAIVKGCTRVMVSSEDSFRDLRAFAPGCDAKVSVHPFPSTFAFEPPAGDAGEAVRKYHLPDKYVLVINQHWISKNHVVVVRALDLLRARGRRLHLVMVGQPSDYRDPQNEHLSKLLQEIASSDLQAQVSLLGRVPYRDLVSLFRCCTVLVQPSRGEGWSTSVQDARALGRPVVCSELPVLREQAPDALGFFGVDDPAGLADLLHRHWDDLPPGPDERAEAAGIEREKAFAAEHGRELLRVCREAASGRR